MGPEIRSNCLPQFQTTEQRLCYYIPSNFFQNSRKNSINARHFQNRELNPMNSPYRPHAANPIEFATPASIISDRVRLLALAEEDYCSLTSALGPTAGNIHSSVQSKLGEEKRSDTATRVTRCRVDRYFGLALSWITNWRGTL